MICHQLRRGSGELYLETILIHSVFDSVFLEFIFTDFSISAWKGYFQNKILDNQNTKLQLLASKSNIIKAKYIDHIWPVSLILTYITLQQTLNSGLGWSISYG
jgi:hypothetical protein